jgi:glycosyltransferase involved in cell wall biosynthesis
VALVAPTLAILGGHAVQAQQMLNGWRGDPAVHPWLVPINPTPRAPLHRLQQIKYVRTVVTQAVYWPLLVRELRRADLAHVFSASSTGFLLSTVPAVVVARLVGTPVLLNYHSGDAPAHLAGSRLARLVTRRLSALVVVPSRFLRDVFARFGVPAQVVFNSIDLPRFGYRARTPLRARLLSTRNLDDPYNVACTLRAFARVQAMHPEASLTIVGTGPHAAALQQLARDLALRHVTFTGRVAPDDMPRHYAEHDIYVQTPSFDNMPLSVLEAFASGLPVVSTRVGGVPAILTDGEHGLLADENDDAGIAAQVTALLANPDRARTMAAAAYASCHPYEWQQVRQGWLSAYRHALQGAHRRTPVPVAAS